MQISVFGKGEETPQQPVLFNVVTLKEKGGKFNGSRYTGSTFDPHFQPLLAEFSSRRNPLGKFSTLF